jgi:hypothetical protein
MSAEGNYKHFLDTIRVIASSPRPADLAMTVATMHAWVSSALAAGRLYQQRARP